MQDLNDNRGAGASDQRDLIFGILGLLVAKTHSTEVDYSRSPEEIYRRVALDILRRSRSLKLLSATGPRHLRDATRKGRHLDLPSWVLDWNISQPPEVSLALGKTFVEPFDAGGRYNLMTNDEQTLMLSTFGVTIGTIVDTCEPGTPTLQNCPSFKKQAKMRRG